MLGRLKSFGAGIAVAVLAMAIYAVALGCFIALLLLIVSMEEGGATLSNATVPLTEAMILLSQGVGFTTGSVTLTIVPLLLTVMLVALIAVLAARIGTGLPGFVSGAAAWVLMSWYAAQGVQVGLLDAPGALMGKALLVFAVGYGLVALPHAELAETFRGRVWDPISVQVRRTIIFGCVAAALIVMALTLAGLATLVAWIVMDYDAMNTLFAMTDMGTGSRIMTTVASLAWLPNLVIWALSWLIGAGFSVGDAAQFTLWTGQSTDLPPLPVFGLFPQPVQDGTVRLALMAVPCVVGLAVGLLVLVGRQGFGVVARLRAGGAESGMRTAVPLLAYPAASSCLAAALVSLFATLAFSLSNGALGTGRLAHVGVDVVASTRATGHGVALGLLAAWLMTLVGVASYFGIRWAAGRMRRGAATAETAETSVPADSGDGSGSEGRGKDREPARGTERRPRVASSREPSPRPEES